MRKRVWKKFRKILLTNQQNGAIIPLVDKSTIINDRPGAETENNLEDFIMVFETIAKLLADRLDCEVSEIKAEDTFHDLGIDSLDTVDLLMNLEDELGLSIELDEKVETVGQLVELVEKKQQEQQ